MTLADYFGLEFATVETDWIDLEVLPGWERDPNYPTRARRSPLGEVELKVVVRPDPDYSGEPSVAQVLLPLSMRPPTDISRTSAFLTGGHIWRQTVEIAADGRVVIGEPVDIGASE